MKNKKLVQLVLIPNGQKSPLFMKNKKLVQLVLIIKCLKMPPIFEK